MDHSCWLPRSHYPILFRSQLACPHAPRVIREQRPRLLGCNRATDHGHSDASVMQGNGAVTKTNLKLSKGHDHIQHINHTKTLEKPSRNESPFGRMTLLRPNLRLAQVRGGVQPSAKNVSDFVALVDGFDKFLAERGGLRDVRVQQRRFG